LLDTHLLYWWMTNDAKLGKATKKLIAEAEMKVSFVSIWEMTLKNAKGKLPLPEGDIGQHLAAEGFNVLPILSGHIDGDRNLVCSHPDPFDRLLIATAQTEGLTFLTRDSSVLALDLHWVIRA
jgi:PIN domain nuclease of toxin-antitoxin system